MNNKKGILANTLSLIGSLIAIGLGYFVFFVLLAYSVASGANGGGIGDWFFFTFFVHAVVVILKFVFSIIGYKTKRVTPEGFLKMGWLTIVNIVLCLIEIVLSVLYICVIPSIWFLVFAPAILYAVAAALYIADYVQNKKLAKQQKANEQQPAVSIELATPAEQTEEANEQENKEI